MTKCINYCQQCLVINMPAVATRRRRPRQLGSVVPISSSSSLQLPTHFVILVVLLILLVLLLVAVLLILVVATCVTA